jgi:phage shock protein C
MYTPTQRLMRSRTDKIIAGVAGGIGQYLAVDPVIVRLAFAALCFTGVGVLLYPVLWLVMPLEGSQRPAPEQALDEMRRQAMRVGDEAREIFVAPGSAPRRQRFDPMTGQPVDPESEIPINNVNPSGTPVDPRARRNQLLGIILLGVGTFILVGMIPGFGHVVGIAGRFMFPLLLVGIGIMMLRRHR